MYTPYLSHTMSLLAHMEQQRRDGSGFGIVISLLYNEWCRRERQLRAMRTSHTGIPLLRAAYLRSLRNHERSPPAGERFKAALPYCFTKFDRSKDRYLPQGLYMLGGIQSNLTNLTVTFTPLSHQPKPVAYNNRMR